ncbi:NAD-dependent succinate-semialdehyde dehydrogenase [Parashewanella curva]|uniref:NAD-dependent succinate-semialdehyde dehydrogenase n=1 Tax=Parashewanella curva TaxID=2338552 RepID=A0A3L8PTC8_9GAMM|nr:NAD-dependent succinate-semialdehyde dehydrogenase [Parashewanella curva]RLV58524.1 NAD-dependent succinate-semialdehyde dehydrogenase [Parashewanella curva]
MEQNESGLLKQQCYIHGHWLDAKNGSEMVISNPCDGGPIATVPNMGEEETQMAISSSEKAQKLWQQQSGHERSQQLLSWFELILANKDPLAELLTLEQGKPIKEAHGEITYAASFIQWYAEEAKRVSGELIASPSSENRIVVMKQAVGVTAAITPWNFPAAMITRKAAAALAAGCSMIVKPAPDTPLTALALAELADQAGIPAGVLNVITGDAKAIGKTLCESPVVRKLSFTGSTQVGRILMAQCAPTIKKLSLELGGNAPFIVFEDADIDAAVEGAIQSKFRNAGQTCVCANRIYVHESIYHQFSGKFAAAVTQLKVGRGDEDGTDIGPLINHQAVKKVQQHVDDALEKGARLLAGGKTTLVANAQKGHFFEPTVLTNMNDLMRIAKEETFGPVAPLFSFSDTDDVIRKANDTEYGLAAYFYAKDLSKVWLVAEALEYGIVGVNTGIISNEVAPFGGVKSSGLGREGGHQGLEEYLETKYINMKV